MNNKTHEHSVSALLVGAFERDRQLVKDIFRACRWRLFEARDRVRALQCLSRHRVHVVITETNVPDWHWRSVLHDIRGLAHPPQLIVTSRHADDRLWAEALNVGAYDVLAQPFERAEVERAVESARRHFEVRPKAPERSRTSAAVA